MGGPRWDLKSGVCPWGHSIDLCRGFWIEKNVLGQIITHNYCRLRKTELSRISRDRRNRKRKDERADQRFASEHPDDSMRFVGRPPKTQTRQIMMRYGKLQQPHDPCKYANIQLVCGHVLTFMRDALWRPDRMSYPLWCHVCQEVKKCHQMTSSIKGQLAMVYYEMDERPEPKVWKHVKNAGSGRA